jgi:hypothetical protein
MKIRQLAHLYKFATIRHWMFLSEKCIEMEL